MNRENVLAILLLIISELIPFLSRYFPTQYRQAGGILHFVFILLFKSGCFTAEQTYGLEHTFQQDIDGDGIIGTPPPSVVFK